MAEKLPLSWLTTTIGSVTLPIEKTDPSKTPTKEIAYLDISGIDNKSNTVVEVKHYLGKDAPSRARQRVKKDDVLFSTVRTYLKNIAVVPAQYDGQIASTGFSILRAVDGLSSQFLFYYSLTSNFLNRLADLQRGSSYPAVRDDDVRIQKIPLPPVDEQKRIVDKIERLFSNIDEGEALLKQVQQQLATYRQSVLKAAVTGELTREWREANKDRLESGEALLQRILKSRRENWQGRGKYKEPVIQYSPGNHLGWIWGVLETFCDVKGGVTVDAKKQIVDPAEIPYLRVANVQDGYLDLTQVKTIKVDKSKIEELVLRKGDVLFTEGGDIDKLGRGWVWEGQISICTHQNHIFRGRPFSEEIHPRFISYYCGSLGKEYFLNGGKQTTNLASISLTKLKAFPIVLPSIAEQVEIVSIIDDIFSQIDALESWCATELTRSTTLRQSILKDAFSGKLVPQDPTDEPASELLKRIQAQKASLNKHKTAKRKTKAIA